MRTGLKIILLCLISMMLSAQEEVSHYDFETGILTLPQVRGLSGAESFQATLQQKNGRFIFDIINLKAVETNAQAASAQFDADQQRLFIPNLAAAELRLDVTLQLQADGRYALESYKVLPQATHETEASLKGDLNMPAIWLHPDDIEDSLILGADGDGGLEQYDLSGQRLDVLLPEGKVKYIDIRYSVVLGEKHVDLIAFTHEAEGVVEFYTIDADTRTLTSIADKPLKPSIEVDGMCLYHSPATGKLYTIVMDGKGAVEQWEMITSHPATMSYKRVRTFDVGGETGSCITDDTTGSLYISEQEASLWRYGAEPETGIERKPIDVAAPLGHLAEVEGLAIYYGRDDGGYLLAANQDNSEYLVYERTKNNRFIGKFSVLGDIGIDKVSKGEGIAVTNVALNSTYPNGVFIAQDSVNDMGKHNFKLVAWERIARYLDLHIDTGINPREIGLAASDIKSVKASGETVPVPVSGDAADDPAIWIHPSDKRLSTVIGTQKQGGVVVYDLAGDEVQYLAAGNINNVDLRYNFPLNDGSTVDIVAGSNRTNNSLSLFSLDDNTRMLSNIAARTIRVPTQNEVYGLCMYRSRKNGRYYVFINDMLGKVTQWALFATNDNKVDAKQVRSFNVGSQTEGCVADDVTGDFYIGEENVGIWKYQAEPDANDERVSVDKRDKDGGHFTADVEGLTLYYVENDGYLIASSQGSNSYTLYERMGDNAYIGEFRLIGNDELGIDGASDTDGITVSHVNFGGKYTGGLFVAQDGHNIVPTENQNFKYARWADIAAQLNLVVNTNYNPRQ